MPPLSRDNIPRKPAFSPDRRCHWFDNNGRPYKRLDGGLGCPRKSNCYFAHPTDIDIWRSARLSGEPPLQYLTDDEYRLIVGRHRSPRAQPSGHTGARYPSPTAERDRRRRERSRSPMGRRRSISREREPTLASRLRGRPSSRERPALGGRSSRSRSPYRPRLQPAQQPLKRSPSPYGSTHTPRGPRTYTSIPEGLGNGGPPMAKVEMGDVTMRDLTAHQVRESSIASSHVASQVQQLTPASPANIPLPTVTGPIAAGSGTAAPAPAPTADAIKSMLESSTLQWQQISTAVAAATSAVPKANSHSLTGDLSMEEKNKIWASRIELLAAATRILNEAETMKVDVKDYKQLMESFSYPSLPAEDRTVIEDHLQLLQSQLQQKGEEVKKLMTQLTAAKFWPTHTHNQAPILGQDDGNMQQEAMKEVEATKGSLSQLQDMLQSVGGRWDQLSKQLQSTGSSSQANTFLAEAIVPSELEKIRDSLAAIEGKLGTVERELSKPREIVLEQIDAIVAENVQAVVLAATGTVQPQPPVPRAALSDEQLKMLQLLQQNAAATAQQVTRLSQEVTQLGAYNDKLQTQNMQLSAENAQLRQQLEERALAWSQAQAPQSATIDSKKIDRMQAEMHALNAAVMAYISRSPNGSQPANGNGKGATDTVVQQITPQIVKSIPELIAPEFQALRNQLQETLRIQQSESAKELSLKMSLTLQAVEAIRVLVGGPHKGPSHGTSSPRPSNATVPVNGMPKV